MFRYTFKAPGLVTKFIILGSNITICADRPNASELLQMQQRLALESRNDSDHLFSNFYNQDARLLVEENPSCYHFKLPKDKDRHVSVSGMFDFLLKWPHIPEYYLDACNARVEYNKYLQCSYNRSVEKIGALAYE